MSENETNIPEEICSPWEKARANSKASIPNLQLSYEDLVHKSARIRTAEIRGTSVERAQVEASRTSAIRRIFFYRSQHDSNNG